LFTLSEKNQTNKRSNQQYLQVLSGWICWLGEVMEKSIDENEADKTREKFLLRGYCVFVLCLMCVRSARTSGMRIGVESTFAHLLQQIAHPVLVRFRVHK